MRNQLIITVSGGDFEENKQMTTMVHACLQEKGFTNVSISDSDVVHNVGSTPMSIFDLIRTMNPDVFDTPIAVMGETDEDIRAAEVDAMDSMMSTMVPRITPQDYRYS